MEAVLTLYSVYIEDFPLLSEEKHCKMRLSLKGEKRGEKPVSVPFFPLRKKNPLKQAQRESWTPVGSSGSAM